MNLLLGHDEMHQAVLAMNLQEQLSLCSDEEDSDEEGNEGEACGGKSEDVYDDGEYFFFLNQNHFLIMKNFTDSTAQMLETYMNEVQNFTVMNVVTADAQTNTETFSEFQQRNHMLRLRERTSASTTSLRDPKIYPIEDRSSLVKRSQTFSPSAVTTCNKSRYICRRSDSDSAMHFNITAAVAQPQPHPFRRGAVERRSLRYHGKVPRLLSSSKCQFLKHYLNSHLFPLK